ncbi:methyl-accepting chemotaxis protein [Hyalangium rubrum]|uniref:Methyl-accepting chemotaxis protein n=1 Tax=Hyalangium rubrum TaxID=3103134 RepID=A0ABU5HH79_9BACT|nr:methyl-accepting chemotaxis protein [Hyalangium sp. s54d21]MDY7232198.1 methyl-accepting chemotaxis protein [Hyalangium sp. s54d21]
MKLPLLGTLKLRGRLTLYTTLVSVVPLFALAWVQSIGARHRIQQQVQDTLEIEAAGLRDMVEATLIEREANVRSWAGDHALRASLQAGNYTESDLELAAFLRRSPTFRGLAFFTLEGQLLSASSPELRQAYAGREAEVLASPWFQSAREERVTDAGLTTGEDPAFGARVLPLAAPVFSPTEAKPLGVLMAAYDWGQLGKVVEPALARASRRSQSSFVIEVVRSDNTVIFDSRGEGAHSNVAMLPATVENTPTLPDVGDGWRFVAQVDPAEAYQSVTRLDLLSFGLSFLFALGAAAGAFLLARTITRPMTALSDMVSRVTQERDLTQQLPVRETADEVGELASGFARMLEHLRETNAGLQHGMRVLNDTVAELKEANRQQEKNIARQAAAIQQTQVTAQEIKQTSLLAAEKAEAVLSVASRAEEVGRSGEAAISGSLGGFEDLRAQVAQMAHRIAQLNERTQQIGGITQTVKDLADQSNMLALNAAIESVRSGEHGKGFGVVAREIRSLADQSIQATERVRDILGDISQAILSTAKMTELGYTRMEEGLEQVRSSGENLKELSTIVQDNSAAVRQIAAAVSQQNAGIAQIFGAVTDLSTMMNETVNSLQATTNATRALQEVAEQMQHVARSYRVS